ncbi:MAG TPA: glycosyltransferase family A protein [Thermoleophilaceae bacterium]|nr:glycosyltransferase family A protein [Thermoleophilaceae bacterium]
MTNAVPVAAVDATVVVPTRDRAASLSRTLEALAAQRTDRPWEVVVVDDGSSPPVSHELAEIRPGWRLVRGEGSGPARARNRGWREARGAVVLFTDDDVEPGPDWLESALAHLAANPDAVGVEGPTDTSPYDPLREMSVASDSPGGYLTANLGFRRDVLELLGGFHEAFPFPHCEDYDLAFRAAELGPIGFAPGMRVLHHPRELSILQLARRGRLAASEVLLFERHRERYGRVRRLPAVAFPFVNAVVGWLAIARRSVGSPGDALRWLAIFSLYLVQLTLGVGRYMRGARLRRRAEASEGPVRDAAPRSPRGR